MKRCLTGIVVLVFIMLPTLLFSGGQSGAEGATGAETAELMVWSLPDINADRPVDKRYLYNNLKRFEQKYPQIQTEFSYQSDENIVSLIRAAGIAKEGPDLCNGWQGGMINNNADFILPLQDHFSQEELDNMLYLKHAWRDYIEGGDLLSVPTGGNAMCMYYSRELFKKAGLSENSEFEDMDEFFAACEKLQSTGVLPIYIGEKEGWAASWFAQALLLQRVGPGIGGDLFRGTANYTDPGFIESYSAYHEIYKRGYCNRDVISSGVSDMKGVFMRKESAIDQRQLKLPPSDN